jgi:hypothetical protein
VNVWFCPKKKADPEVSLFDETGWYFWAVMA